MRVRILGVNLLQQLFDANVWGDVLGVATAERVQQLLVQRVNWELATGGKRNRAGRTAHVHVRIVVVRIARFEIGTVVAGWAGPLHAERGRFRGVPVAGSEACGWRWRRWSVLVDDAAADAAATRVDIIVVILFRIVLGILFVRLFLGHLGRRFAIDRGVERQVLLRAFFRRFSVRFRWRLFSFLAFRRLGREKLRDRVRGHEQWLEHVVA